MNTHVPDKIMTPTFVRDKIFMLFWFIQLCYIILNTSEVSQSTQLL